MAEKNYARSQPEQDWADARKEQKEADAVAIAANNKALIGEPKTYKGIRYQQTNMTHIVCLDYPTDHPHLGGIFSTAYGLHKIIDDLEKSGRLPK